MKKSLLVMVVVLIWSTGLLVGQQTWKKTFGGKASEDGQSISTTSDGGILITGNFYSNDGDFNGMYKGYEDIFVFKLDKDGGILWTKTFGGTESDYGYSITTTSDGGILITGATYYSRDGDFEGMNKGELDIFVMKLDMNGEILWKKLFGGSDKDIGQSITTTSDGGVLITGYTDSNDGDFEGMNKGRGGDIFVMKLDKDGGILWKKTFGGSVSDFGYSITTTSDDGVLITGYFHSNDGDFNEMYKDKDYADIFVMKLDKDGGILWTKTFGGTKGDYGYSVATTSDASVLITGGTSSNDGDFYGMNKGESDIFVITLDKDGQILWKKTFGGSVSEHSRSITTTSDGGVLITGYFHSNDGDFNGMNQGYMDIFVMKLDKDGGILWTKTLGGRNIELGFSLTTTSDGGILITGFTYSNDGDFKGMSKGIGDIFVIKLDSNGNLNPTTSIEEPSDLSYSFRVTPNPLSSVSYASYTIDNSSRVRIELVNSMGEVVSVLSDRPEDRGSHRLPINTAGLISGAYTLRMIANGHVVNRRVVLVR